MNYPLIIGIESAFFALLLISILWLHRKVKREMGQSSSIREQIEKNEERLSSIKEKLLETRKTDRDLRSTIDTLKEEIAKFSKETESRKIQAEIANANQNQAIAELKQTQSSIIEANKKYQSLKEETLALQELKTNADKLQDDISKSSEQLKQLQSNISRKEIEHKDAQLKIREIMSYVDLYSRIEEFTTCGHFEEPEYLYETSARFTEEIKIVRDKQKNILKSNIAITYPPSISITSDNITDKKILSGQINLMLSAFNIECDLLIGKVRPSNFTRTLEQIENLAAKLEKSAATLHCGFNTEYVKLKYEECKLQYQFKLKKEEEKEEQRLLNEQMREEIKAQKEYEKAIAEAEKEERMYRQLLEKAKESLAKANQDEQIILKLRIEDLERQLSEAVEKEERAKSMAEQTRRGHVYIISNVGSFGKNVYKIGLTRRLDPLDRVNELGDASVPFKFDIHAIIHAEDAPALETTLHREFKRRRVNAVNLRKEFFNVSLEEIKSATEKIVGSDVDFTTTALAEEYYETRRLQQEISAELVN